MKKALLVLCMLAFVPAQTALAMGRESVETESSAIRPSLFAAGEARQATGTSRDGWASNPAVLALVGEDTDHRTEFGVHTSLLSAGDVDGWIAGGLAAIKLHPLVVQFHGRHLSLDGKAPVGQLRWRASEVGITSALALDWLHAPRFSVGAGVSVLVDHEMRYQNEHERVSIHNKQPVTFSVGGLYNGNGWRIGLGGLFNHAANSHETVENSQSVHHERATSDDAAVAIGFEVQPFEWLWQEYAELLTLSVDGEWLYRSIAYEGDDKGHHEKYGIEVLLPRRLNPISEIIAIKLVGGYRQGCFGDAWGIGASLVGQPNTAWSHWGMQFGYSNSQYRHQHQSDIFNDSLEMTGLTLVLKL